VGDRPSGPSGHARETEGGKGRGEEKIAGFVATEERNIKVGGKTSLHMAYEVAGKTDRK